MNESSLFHKLSTDNRQGELSCLIFCEKQRFSFAFLGQSQNLLPTVSGVEIPINVAFAVKDLDDTGKAGTVNSQLIGYRASAQGYTSQTTKNKGLVQVNADLLSETGFQLNNGRHEVFSMTKVVQLLHFQTFPR